MKHRYLLALLAILCTNARSQSDTMPAEKLTPKSATGAGFQIVYDGLYEPSVSESSNSTIYGFSLRRISLASGVYAPDTVMPLARLTQTVAQLTTISTTENLLEATITDARTSICQLLNDYEYTLPEPTDCTREIASISRTGKRFQIEKEGEPIFVECYAFEDEAGKGIGVILKYQAGINDATKIDESVLLDDIISDLTILPVTIFTPYVYMLAEYPLSLPIGSQLSNLKQASEHAITAQIAMYGVTGNMKLMLIPDGYSVFDTASEIKSNHENELKNQRDQGKISILWDSVSMFPVGPEAGGKAQPKVALVKFLGGSAIYNQHHVLVDDRYIIEYSFNCAPAEVENLHGYAQALYAKARPDFGFDVHKRRIYSAPGYEVHLPYEYQHQSNYSDGRLESMVIHSAEIVLPKLFPVSALRHKPSTQIRFYPSDAGVTLEDTHREICQQIREHSRERTLYPDEEPYDQALTELQLSLPGGSSANAVSSMFLAKNNANSGYRTGTEYENTRITSILVPAKDGHTMAVVSCVANVLMHPDALAASLQIAQWTKPIEHPGKVELEFANLEFDPWTIEMVQYPTHSDGSDTKRFTFGTDTVTIAHETIPEESLGLSDLELTELFIQPAYNWISHADEADHYPKDPEELTKATLAGRDALYFEHQLYAPLLYDGRTRTKSVYFRIYGVRHGNRYMVVTMRQDDNFYAHRFENYHTMFTPKD